SPQKPTAAKRRQIRLNPCNRCITCTNLITEPIHKDLRCRVMLFRKKSGTPANAEHCIGAYF
ncbi:MAG TPA: hypothetical protein DDZ82_05455, partial [Rhodobacteraceae bacterium]|nr:hypothetical protein [Paracoccaceae bacterium]